MNKLFFAYEAETIYFPLFYDNLVLTKENTPTPMSPKESNAGP